MFIFAKKLGKYGTKLMDDRFIGMEDRLHCRVSAVTLCYHTFT